MRRLFAAAALAALAAQPARSDTVCEAIDDLLMTGIMLLDVSLGGSGRDNRLIGRIRSQLDWVAVVGGGLRTTNPDLHGALEQVRRQGEALYEIATATDGRISRQSVEVFHGQVRRLHMRQGCGRSQSPYASAEGSGAAHASGELPASVAASGPGGSGGGGESSRRGPRDWYAEAQNKQEIHLWTIFTLLALVVVPPLFGLERRRARRGTRYLFTATAELLWPGGRRSPARFLDISCLGARLILEEPIGPGAEFAIEIEGASLPARVMWSHDLLAGVMFTARQGEDVIDGLRRTQEMFYGLRA
ncbi:hypothetical protein HKCCE3408_15920 [Rhodobacterales bacterium HKCCE3408]|nr:hypothetical protein [Rhodobacterales bacterium HKCCE3408]